MILVVAFFQPAAFPLDGKLDPSIFAAYAYYTANGVQFGPEIVAMAGPYGFVMYGQFYGGDLFWLRLALELVVQGIFVALLLWFFLRAPTRSIARWLWIPAHLLFSTVLPDITIGWTMLLIGVFLLEENTPPSHRWHWVFAGLLGLFALFKGTHLTLSFATIGIVTLVWLLRRERRRAVAILGSYTIGLILFWTLARQNPLHLFSYISGTFHLTDAYTSAMSFDGPRSVAIRGALLACSFLAALTVTAWIYRRDLRQLGALALLAGYSFVMWKHGFIRADGHVVIFFGFIVTAILAWHLQFFAHSTKLSRTARWFGGCAAASLVALALVAESNPLLQIGNRLAAAWPSFTYRLTYLTSLPDGFHNIEELLRSQRELLDMPRTRDEVGDASVDFFGVEQGLVLLNRFNYQPRPVAGGAFNVYNLHLMRLNRDFLRDPARRPEYYLLKLDSIDQRLVMQDDHLALRELLFQYRPILLEQQIILLRADSTATATPEPQLLERRTIRLDESVTLPVVAPTHLLLARFLPQENLTGRLRTLVYKPKPLHVILQDRDQQPLGRRRLIPSLAAAPFIVSPLIDRNEDLLDLYSRDSGREIASLTVVTETPLCYQDEIQVEFYSLPRPSPVDEFVLNGFRTHFRFPFANVEPQSITPAFREHRWVRFVHAPAEIVWPLTGLEREFSFHYGIDPEAYERGTTNGVDFIVEVRGPSGAAHRVFSRRLEPQTNPADRGTHTADLTLPLYGRGSQLILRTEPGAHGDTAWDWSYVTRMELKRPDGFSPTLFPRFSRLPFFADAEHSAVIDQNGEQSLLLHVPGSLHFRLDGNERSLTLDFGFLPGAYSDGGATPGAEFVAELHRPDAPPEEIWRRSLRPVSNHSDRGQQSGRIEFPPVSPGEVLVIRTKPIPGATNSWGWTYLSRVIID